MHNLEHNLKCTAAVTGMNLAVSAGCIAGMAACPPLGAILGPIFCTHGIFASGKLMLDATDTILDREIKTN